MYHFCYREIANFYDRVRLLLSGNEGSLTDEMIDYPENAPFAERMVRKKLQKEFEEYDEDKFMLIQTAIVYQTAIRMIPYTSGVSNDIKIGQTQSLKIEYRENENFDLLSALQSTLDDLMREINDEGLEDESFTFPAFDITNRRRCRW